ncbi:hypothetical protein ARALYDRAFT_897226 [Arabidopsis lyrata subsp. lyrata]|uniref:S-protein homolog n=1 Tax=Arabidopsis lyrata subsp. lyrata TaxID=81972 RepID=D7L8Z1_ARALL|nr:hypothetical protein ARALYDRAFT_897226 [Arabidopsis lyrata subsp. lyrata]
MVNNIFFYLFVIIFLYFGSSEAISLKCHQNTITFQNNLFASRGILKVHCKSKNDDLGEHFVNYEGPTYNFSFHDNIIFNTEFDCDLWKGDHMEYHQSFVAYTSIFLINCGELHTWDARDNAIYYSKDGKPEELKFQWIKN